MQGSRDRRAPRGVPVEQKNDAGRVAPQELCLVRREGRAQGRDDVAHPVGVQAHDVEVALDHDRALLLPDGVPRLVQPEERAPLRVDGALGGVDVLGGRLRGGGGALFGDVLQRAPAEGDDATLRVDDREHEAVAEAVVVALAARPRHEEADRLGGDGRDALRLHEGRQAVPPRRGVADAEGLEGVVDGGLVGVGCLPGPAGHEAAAGELVQRVLALRVLAQLLLEVRRRELVHGVEVVTLLLLAVDLAALGAVLLLDHDPGPLRERPHGLGEREPVRLHEEVDGAAGLFAAEAVEEPAVGVHVEARGLLLVKRAQPYPRAPAALQGRHALGDDGDEVRPIPHERDGVRGDQSLPISSRKRRGNNLEFITLNTGLRRGTASYDKLYAPGQAARDALVTESALARKRARLSP